MDMIECDGQPKSFELFGMTDRFDLFNQVRSITGPRMRRFKRVRHTK